VPDFLSFVLRSDWATDTHSGDPPGAGVPLPLLGTVRRFPCSPEANSFFFSIVDGVSPFSLRPLLATKVYRVVSPPRG